MSGEDAQYKKYYENMEVWQISEGKSDMDSETHEASTEECIHTIEEMQQAMTTAANKIDENRRRTKPQEERGPAKDSSKEKQPDKSATQGTATTDTTNKKKESHENQRAINHPIPNNNSSTCRETTDTDTNKTTNEAARPRSLREALHREIGRWTHLHYEAQHHYDGHDKQKEGRTNAQ